MERRPLGTLYLLLGLLLAFATGGVGRATAQEQKNDAKKAADLITPELDRCTLEAEGRTVKPVRTPATAQAEHAARDHHIIIEGATIVGFKKGEDKPLWTTKASDVTELAWLAAGEGLIYLAGYKIDKKSQEELPESPLRVRRLEIESGKWLEHLAVEGKPGPKKIESILGVLTSGARVVVLTGTIDDDKDSESRGQLISYRVSCFKTRETRPVWSKTFPSAGQATRPGVFLLWAAASPPKVQPDVQPLTWLGKNVLVCAGSVQDLLCLEGDTGKQRWRVERVWEYQRFFIGPSVWQHVFGRAGEEDDDKKNNKLEKGNNRPPARQHAIIGGPVVVDLPKERRGNHVQSIFLAVANGPSRFGEYLSDCVVYELDSGGKPLAMVNLPRMIQGGRYRVQKDGVVWACQGGAFAKLGISRHRDVHLGMGPGGPDLLCRIDWYRHLVAPEEPEAWLKAAPAGDPLAFGEEFAFRVCAGGYVKEPDAGAYHFPLAMIDLRTGVGRTLTLHVPYQGKLPEPKTNFSHTQLPRGKDRWQTLGPHILAITWLQAEGKRLRVTLGMEKWTRSIEFEIDQLRRRRKQ